MAKEWCDLSREQQDEIIVLSDRANNLRYRAIDEKIANGFSKEYFRLNDLAWTESIHCQQALVRFGSHTLCSDSRIVGKPLGSDYVRRSLAANGVTPETVYESHKRALAIPRTEFDPDEWKKHCMSIAKRIFRTQEDICEAFEWLKSEIQKLK